MVNDQALFWLKGGFVFMRADLLWGQSPTRKGGFIHLLMPSSSFIRLMVVDGLFLFYFFYFFFKRTVFVFFYAHSFSTRQLLVVKFSLTLTSSLCWVSFPRGVIRFFFYLCMCRFYVVLTIVVWLDVCIGVSGHDCSFEHMCWPRSQTIRKKGRKIGMAGWGKAKGL